MFWIESWSCVWTIEVFIAQKLMFLQAILDDVFETNDRINLLISRKTIKYWSFKLF